MVNIQIEYQGDLHCRATHGPSGVELSTDAPKDNQGRGESFSPTDLVATALGTCMLTTMGILARTLNIDITGTTATIEKEMTATPLKHHQPLPSSTSLKPPRISIRLFKAPSAGSIYSERACQDGKCTNRAILSLRSVIWS